VTRIVFIITGLSTGGAETMLLKLLERLDPRFEAHVISLSGLGEIGPRIQALGIQVDALGMRGGLPSPLAFARLLRRLRALRPDVVHTWMYHADLLGGLAARCAGVSALAWCIRNSNLDPRLTKRSTRAVAFACALFSRWLPRGILVCSSVARQLHADLGYAADRMAVIPNGFDLARFRPDAQARLALRHELGLAGDALLIGMVGRFDPQKDHAGFFRAAGVLHARHPAAHFVLAGAGVDASNTMLMRAAESAGIRKVTHLLGLRSDMPRLMAALDLLVLSSAFGEAFPNVVGEAMACGVPCVVTDVGDSAWIVGDTGRVVLPGDNTALAQAMQDLLELPVQQRQALGVRARARVLEHFEIGQVVAQYEAFFDGLARRPGEG
jgi:glycosyltransferase involved in cell wall biosynthesis